MPHHRVVPNVFSGFQERIGIADPYFREAFLPDWCDEPKLPSCSKRKPSLNELHCPLNRHVRPNREQSMEVIGHDYEFMEPEFALAAVVV